MANPQIESGHTKIANEIAEALSRINLSAYESRALWCIFRKTYGWNKKTDRISYSQFEEFTGLKRWHIARTLNNLAERQIIVISGEGQHLEYGIQKDYEKWTKPLPKEVIVSTIKPLPIQEKPLPIQEKPLPKEVTKPLPKEVNTKDKRQTKALDKSKGNGNLIFLKEQRETFDNYQESLRQRFADLDFNTELEKFWLYWKEGRRKLNNPKLALLNWMTKAREIKKQGGNNHTAPYDDPDHDDPDRFIKGKYGHLVRRGPLLCQDE